MFGTSEAIDVTPSRIVFLLMLNMLVGMKDSNVKFLINDLAACQDKKIIYKQLDRLSACPKILQGCKHNLEHPVHGTIDVYVILVKDW